MKVPRSHALQSLLSTSLAGSLTSFLVGSLASLLAGSLASLLAGSLAPVAASTATNFDSALVKLYAAIEDQSQAKTPNSDTLLSLNQKLEAYLLENASDAALLNSPMLKAKRRLWITDSKDHNLRVYSWDTLTGGTIRSYGGVVQFRAGDVIKGAKFPAESTSHDGAFYYPEVATFKTKSCGTVYVVSGQSIGSQADFGGIVSAVRVDGGKLQKVQFFKPSKASTKLLDTISFDYRSSEPSEVVGIDLTNHNRILRVPLIDKERNDTGGGLIYKFDGDKFVYAGASP